MNHIKPKDEMNKCRQESYSSMAEKYLLCYSTQKRQTNTKCQGRKIYFPHFFPSVNLKMRRKVSSLFNEIPDACGFIFKNLFLGPGTKRNSNSKLSWSCIKSCQKCCCTRNMKCEAKAGRSCCSSEEVSKKKTIFTPIPSKTSNQSSTKLKTLLEKKQTEKLSQLKKRKKISSQLNNRNSFSSTSQNNFSMQTLTKVKKLKNLSLLNLQSFFSFLLLTSIFFPKSVAIPIRWDLGPFSDCSVMCGRGTQNRTVVCREIPEGHNRSSSPYQYRPKGNLMPDLMCPAPKPPEKQDCSQVACPPKWLYGPWKKCSESCGRGIQVREKRCMQKLGTGKTVRLPNNFCRKQKRFTKRLCNHRRSCAPRWFYSRWSVCGASCGTGVQRRSVLCGRIQAGRRKPTPVSSSLCRNQRKPINERECKKSDCLDVSSPPIIRFQKGKFLQSRPRLRVRFTVGQQASLIPSTTVFIRCPVENLSNNAIRWSFNGQRIQSRSFSPRRRFAKSRVSVLNDGSLRIIRSRTSDAGTYACHVGSVSAFSVIDFQSHSADSFSRTASDSESFDISPSPSTNVEHLDQRGDPVSFPQPAALLASPITVRRRPIFVSTMGPVPQVEQPQISYVHANPVLAVNLRVRDYPEVPTSYEHEEKSTKSFSSELISKILDRMSFSEIQSGSRPLSVLLNKLMRTSSLYEQGFINADVKKKRDMEIYNKLRRLTIENQERISARGNTARSTDFANNQIITRFLEELPQPASIISQPTMTPLQLDRDVTAYVGGHLMVADAERVTILCEASGTPEPKITWYRNGNKLPEPSQRQFVLHEGSLRLLYLKLSDAGSYKCVASNSHGNDSRTTELSVMQKPRIFSTTLILEDFKSDKIEATVGSDIRAKLGSRIIIRCPVEGYPDPYVVWRKDASGLGQNTKVLEDNSIEINPATAEYQGLFSCEASNPAGSDYQASSLVLIDPPRISGATDLHSDVDGVSGLPELLLTNEAPPTYEVKVNSTVMMGCPVVGFPIPTLTWFFNDFPLDNMEAWFEFELMKSGKVLQISNVDERVEGNFTCSANNEGGNLSTSLRLRIITFAYHYGGLTTCSASCGNVGTQFREVVCLRDGAVEVDEWYCTGLEKPDKIVTSCNRIDCPPKFIMGPWSSCSVSCGNGTRSRTPSCMVIMSDGSTREVARQACTGNFSIKSQSCFRQKCPEWRTGAWRRCSRKCTGRGVGFKMRRIHCVDASGRKVRNRNCPANSKPKRRMPCPNPRCSPMWVTSPWSVCSQSCGPLGFKTRIVNCVYRGRKKQPAGNQCSGHPMPATKLTCNRKRCQQTASNKKRKNFAASCIDQHTWCPRALSLRLCKHKHYSKACCRSCKR